MKQLTVDTNVLRDIADPGRADHPVAMRLFELHKEGRCDIRVTTRLDVDVPDDPVRRELDALQLLEVATVFRIGSSRLDHDFLAGGQDIADEQQLLTRLFPGASPDSEKHKNRLADIDHLLGHKQSGRDTFVTRDRGILHHRHWLASELGIAVASPEEAIREVLDAEGIQFA